VSDEAIASTTTGACRHSISSLKVNKYITMDKYVKDANEKSAVCTHTDLVSFVHCELYN